MPISRSSSAGENNAPVGLLTIDAERPLKTRPSTVSIAGVTDADNISYAGAITGPVSYVWQVEHASATASFEDIMIATGLGDVRATGTTFAATAEVGLALRVKAIVPGRQRRAGDRVLGGRPRWLRTSTTRRRASPTISDTTPTEGRALTVNTIPSSIPTVRIRSHRRFTFQWQQSTDGSIWDDAADEFGSGENQALADERIGLMLRVRVTYTDLGGTEETVFSLPTKSVADDGSPFIIGTELDDVLSGTDGEDVMFGMEGNDTLTAFGADDQTRRRRW